MREWRTFFLSKRCWRWCAGFGGGENDCSILGGRGSGTFSATCQWGGLRDELAGAMPVGSCRDVDILDFENASLRQVDARQLLQFWGLLLRLFD